MGLNILAWHGSVKIDLGDEVVQFLKLVRTFSKAASEQEDAENEGKHNILGQIDKRTKGRQKRIDNTTHLKKIKR